jgi:hypothetical protein
MLENGLVTTQSGTLPIGDGIREVSICVHSDTPVSSERAFFNNTSKLISGSGRGGDRAVGETSRW